MKKQAIEYISSGGKIPLFDIDWTLLKGKNPVHMAGMDFAIKTIYHLPNASMQEISYEGKIDTQIILETVMLHGISENEAKEKIDEAVNVVTTYFHSHADDVEFTALPGVEKLLNLLYQQYVPLGLLTGNIENIAWTKVEKAGIKKYLSFGAFGDMAYKRVELITIAKQQAERLLNYSIPLEQFVIIGDSPNDIACAKAGGIKVLAVATGDFVVEELQESDANMVINSLEEKGKVLQFLGID